MSHPEAQKIVLGGREREMVLTISAFNLAKLQHGVTMTAEEIDNLGFESLPRLLWISLLADDPDLTERDCMAMLVKDPAAERDALKKAKRLLQQLFEGLGDLGDGAEGKD